MTFSITGGSSSTGGAVLCLFYEPQLHRLRHAEYPGALCARSPHRFLWRYPVQFPADLRSIETEGFSIEAARYFEWMEAQGARLRALFEYGFRFGRSDVNEELVHDSLAEVADRVVKESLNSGDPFRAVIAGVDDAWEVSLLHFMLEMIQKSHEINIFDFRRRGLI